MLQPNEGVTGTLRSDDLLSLADEAVNRRAIMMAMGYSYYRLALDGLFGKGGGGRAWVRCQKVQPGDLVMESMRGVLSLRDNGCDPRAFGILLDRRNEWAHTDEEWQDYLTSEGHAADEERETRPVEHDVFYVQYGPQPDDICRWMNCTFIALPTSLDFGGAL